MNTGWVCPKCGDVYAPHVPTCSHCNATSLADRLRHPRESLPVIVPQYMPGGTTGDPMPPLPKVWCVTTLMPPVIS